VAACKFRWRAAVVFAAFVGLSVAVCLVMKTQYTASASVLVKLGRELVYRAPVGETATATPAEDHDEVMASIIAIMEDPVLVRSAIQKIGLVRLYPDMAPDAPPATGPAAWIGSGLAWLQMELGNGQQEDPLTTAVRRFKRKLDVAVIKRTGILTVSFSHASPAIAAEAANTVVALFQQEAGKIYDEPNLTYMQSLVDKERAGLASAQAALSAYQQKYGVYNVDDQINALLTQKIAIDTNLKADAAHIAELQILVGTLAQQRASLPRRTVLFTDTQRNRVVDDTEQALLTLQVQERQMATRFAANYPPLVEVRNQIAVAQQSLKAARAEPGEVPRLGMSETFVTVEQSLLQHQAELDSFAGRQTAMKTQLASIEQTLAGLSERKRALAELQQEVDLRNDAVKVAYTKLAEARAIDGLNHEKPSSFSMYQPALPPDAANPSRPLPVLYTLIGMVVGLIGAATTIFLSYVMDSSFLTPELAGARLRLPVLGVVDYRRNLARLGRVGLLSDASGAARDLTRG
jgi:uncharacterized protein involved in exopolysaccharide biosynthesis